MIRLLLAAALSLLPAIGAWGHDYRVKDIRVDHPFATPTVQGAPTGAVYFTLTNQGKAADRLLGASTPRAKRVELHTMTMAGDVMRMREVSAIDVKPGQPVKMQPGASNHLMLIGLSAPLKSGDRFPMTLRFEKAGSVEVEVLVQNPAPAKEAAHEHPH